MPGLSATGELVRLEVPAVPAFVGVARSVVIAVASVLDGIDEDQLEDLRVAVSEAVTSALESHRRDAVDDSIVVTCRADAGGELHVVIEDFASGMDVDADAVPAPPGPDAGPTASEQGWGVQLIQALVDDVSFEQTEAGTTVDLMIRLGAN